MKRIITKVNLVGDEGTTEVEAYGTASPYIAVTYAFPDHEENGGSLADVKRCPILTHVPTGFAMSGILPSVTKAQHLAAIAAKLPVPWESTDKDAITKACYALPKPINEWFFSAIVNGNV